jgi:hypothetical protein
MAIDEPKLLTTPSELSQWLFSSVLLRNENKVMNEYHRLLKKSRGFDAAAFDKQTFVYLVASIAVALRSISQQTAGTQAAVARFRALVAAEMHKRWKLTGDTVDAVVEEAARDFADLLFTEPGDNDAKPFQWALRWLARIGVQENNPQLLFGISLTWIRHGLEIAEVLNQVDIVDSGDPS